MQASAVDFDAIILGAGGAGLMAAATAGQGGAKVLLVDHADKPGKKILISGGGRCNFTNTGAEAGNYLSENPHFAKSALSRYTQWDFLGLVEAHKIAWHEKTLGQLFCDGSARQIVAMLLSECEKGDVALRLGAPVGQVLHRDGAFHVNGASAPNLVIATGGLSIPKMGATGLAFELARQFGLPIVPTRPALVPFTLAEAGKLLEAQAGIAVPQAMATAGGMTFEEAVLFTHKGLSGPAILQVSSYWSPGDPVVLNLWPDAHAGLLKAKAEMPRAHLKAALADYLPNRLAEALAARCGLSQELANVPNAELARVADDITALTFTPNGTEGYAKAEVTAGGIDTDALSSKTMEARKVPGLFAIGEAVDVTGWLGGYNFQWAWSSGVAAGQEIARRAQQS